MNKIAVIMSVYNNDTLQHVEEALESLYKQKISLDVFIQQDGKVEQKVDSYLQGELQKQKIVYVGKRAENRGLAYSLNELLDLILAQDYEYIARMDADDISLPKRFEKQYKFMLENRDVDIVGGYIEEFSSEISYNKVVKYPLSHDEMYKFFAKRVPVAHVTAFFRRSFFEKAGVYPTISKTNEDTLLWMNGFKAGCRFANIPEVLVRVRVTKDFFTRRGGVEKAWSDFKDRWKVIKTLGYNKSSYVYAIGLFTVSIMPSEIKKFFYKRLR